MLCRSSGSYPSMNVARVKVERSTVITVWCIASRTGTRAAVIRARCSVMTASR